MTGEVQLDDGLTRMPVYQVYGLNADYDQISLLTISLNNGTTVSDSNATFSFRNFRNSPWNTLTNQRQSGIFGEDPVLWPLRSADSWENLAR